MINAWNAWLSAWEEMPKPTAAELTMRDNTQKALVEGASAITKMMAEEMRKEMGMYYSLPFFFAKMWGVKF